MKTANRGTKSGIGNREKEQPFKQYAAQHIICAFTAKIDRKIESAKQARRNIIIRSSWVVAKVKVISQP